MKILNADPSFGRPLTENQIKDFLSNSKLNIHIATIDEKGQPNIHPTWYYFGATKNKIYEAAKSSRKVENMNRNNLIYYCIDVPYMPYKGVRGKGKVRIHEDINHNIPIIQSDSHFNSISYESSE